MRSIQDYCAETILSPKNIKCRMRLYNYKCLSPSEDMNNESNIMQQKESLLAVSFNKVETPDTHARKIEYTIIQNWLIHSWFMGSSYNQCPVVIHTLKDATRSASSIRIWRQVTKCKSKPPVPQIPNHRNHKLSKSWTKQLIWDTYRIIERVAENSNLGRKIDRIKL